MTSWHSDLPKVISDRPKTNRKASKINDLGVSKANTPTKRKTRQIRLRNAKSEIYENRVVLELPLQTKSEANCFEPWRKKHDRHKAQQRAVFLALSPIKLNIKLPCKIMLTRFAPNELDKFDNLPSSFKYIVDAICAVLTGDYRAGKADSDKRITISCDQTKCPEYGIRIEIICD